jgi:hypothetical protein
MSPGPQDGEFSRCREISALSASTVLIVSQTRPVKETASAPLVALGHADAGLRRRPRPARPRRHPGHGDMAAPGRTRGHPPLSFMGIAASPPSRADRDRSSEARRLLFRVSPIQATAIEVFSDAGSQ